MSRSEGARATGSSGRPNATGLTYMQARYYDPVIGRFLSIDPVGFSPGRPDMFNRYAYAANDPVNMLDPDGNFVVALPIAACAGGGCELAAVAVVAGIATVATIAEDPNAAATAVLTSPLVLPLITLLPNEQASDETPDFTDTEEKKPPFVGEPGSTVRGPTGSRTYGPDGYPLTDRDTPHPGEAAPSNDDHCHDWCRPADGGKPDHNDRGPPRAPKPGDPPKPRGPNVPPDPAKLPKKSLPD